MMFWDHVNKNPATIVIIGLQGYEVFFLYVPTCFFFQFVNFLITHVTLFYFKQKRWFPCIDWI